MSQYQAAWRRLPLNTMITFASLGGAGAGGAAGYTLGYYRGMKQNGTVQVDLVAGKDDRGNPLISGSVTLDSRTTEVKEEPR